VPELEGKTTFKQILIFFPKTLNENHFEQFFYFSEDLIDKYVSRFALAQQ
jgi:hypothetical protein